VIQPGKKDAALDAKVLAALGGGQQLRAKQLVTLTGASHREVDHSLGRLQRTGKIVLVSAVAGWKIQTQ
jgi:hypothetical protein